MTDIQPIHGIPALKAGSRLVIGDLHMGVESHLLSKGYRIPSKTMDMFDAIEKSAEDCSHLVVVGDVKNTVPGSSKQEYREIPDFFIELTKIFNTVTVVRGNHDTNIEEFLPKEVKIAPATGMRVDDIGYVHGHTWPSEDVMKCKTLIMAHNHPAVMFIDGIGKQTIEPCWVRGEFISGGGRYGVYPKEFIIVPAFNKILGGSPVNLVDGEFLGPLMSDELVNIKKSKLYLLDGICLGTIEDMMVKPPSAWLRRRRNF